MNKKILFGAGGVLLVALLAGAAFTAVRLLNTHTSDPNGSNSGSGSGPVLQGKSNGPGGAQSFAIHEERATQLPPQNPDVAGLVGDIQGNTFSVSPTSKVTVINGAMQATPDGPSVEVVVSKDTQIWRDVTMDNVPKPSGGSADSPMNVQQKLEAVDISAITSSNMVQVWGQKRGDRIIADTIVVSGPAVVKGGPKGGQDGGPQSQGSSQGGSLDSSQ